MPGNTGHSLFTTHLAIWRSVVARRIVIFAQNRTFFENSHTEPGKAIR